MKKYYLIIYVTVENPDLAYNDVIDCRPTDWLIKTFIEQEFFYLISALRISKKQYKKYIKEREENCPDWYY